jgi:hypothetical protein
MSLYAIFPIDDFIISPLVSELGGYGGLFRTDSNVFLVYSDTNRIDISRNPLEALWFNT